MMIINENLLSSESDDNFTPKRKNYDDDLIYIQLDDEQQVT